MNPQVPRRSKEGVPTRGTAKGRRREPIESLRTGWWGFKAQSSSNGTRASGLLLVVHPLLSGWV